MFGPDLSGQTPGKGASPLCTPPFFISLLMGQLCSAAGVRLAPKTAPAVARAPM